MGFVLAPAVLTTITAITLGIISLMLVAWARGLSEQPVPGLMVNGVILVAEVWALRRFLQGTKAT